MDPGFISLSAMFLHVAWPFSLPLRVTSRIYFTGAISCAAILTLYCLWWVPTHLFKNGSLHLLSHPSTHPFFHPLVCPSIHLLNKNSCLCILLHLPVPKCIPSADLPVQICTVIHQSIHPLLLSHLLSFYLLSLFFSSLQNFPMVGMGCRPL